MLFVPSEKIGAITPGEVERIKIVTCAELFVPSGRMMLQKETYGELYNILCHVVDVFSMSLK